MKPFGAPSDTAENPLPGERQMVLPGMPERSPVAEPEPEKPFDAQADYGGFHGAHLMDGDWTPNPLFRQGVRSRMQTEARERVNEGMTRSRETEFVQPSRVFSQQGAINQNAVDHQVAHANPLALTNDPTGVAFTDDDGEESYVIDDGNHRVNAAQRRGQLLMPADVTRFSFQTGSNSMRRAR